MPRSLAQRLVATTTIAVLLFPFRPLPARAQLAETEAASDAFAAPDATQSLKGATDASNDKQSLPMPDLPVAATGSFSTSFPFALPAGRGGMSPSLGLSYDSGSTSDSAFGLGWSIGVQSIDRSFRNGFPALVRGPGNVLQYAEAGVDGAEFEAFGVPLVEVTSSPIGLPTKLLASDSRFLAPLRRQDMTLVERSASQDAFVVHRPDGSKAFYGRSPPGSAFREARVTNELGTASWMLLEERDTDANAIEYDYVDIVEQARSDRSRPQLEPLLATVQWGANQKSGRAHIFKAEVSYGNLRPAGITGDTSSEIDFRRGGMLVAPRRATSVAVCGPRQTFSLADGTVASAGPNTTSGPCAGVSEIRSYQFTQRLSIDTGRVLLGEVKEFREGSQSPLVTTYSYSSNGGKVRFGSPEPLVKSSGDEQLTSELLLTRTGYSTRNFGALTRPEAMTPLTTSGGSRQMDINGDGRSDIVYHPSGMAAPAAKLVTSASPQILVDGFLFAPFGILARSGVKRPDGRFDVLTEVAGESPEFDSAISDDGVRSLGYAVGTRYSDFADLDGDGRDDGVAFRISETSTPARGRRGRYSGPCYSDAFYRRCGIIDPYDSASICELTTICDDFRAADMSTCSDGRCYITERDFVVLFADVGDWESTPPLSAAGQALLATSGWSANLDMATINVDAMSLQARLNIDTDMDKLPETVAMASGATTMEKCEGLMGLCLGQELDGIPQVRIAIEFDGLMCHVGEDGVRNHMSICDSWVPSATVRRLPPVQRIDVDLGGGSFPVNQQSYRPSFPLYGWPSGVAKVFHTFSVIEAPGFSPPPYLSQIVQDFTAPLVDLNGDGRADVLLLREMRQAASPRAEFNFVPAAWITESVVTSCATDLDCDPNHDVCNAGICVARIANSAAREFNFLNDWPPESLRAQNLDEMATLSRASAFNQSLQDILFIPGRGYQLTDVEGDPAVGGPVDAEQEKIDYHLFADQLRFMPGAAYNAFPLDLNTDGLPDLVVSRPDDHRQFSDTMQRKRDRHTVDKGHDVFLNRGYRFGQFTVDKPVPAPADSYGLPNGPLTRIMSSELTAFADEIPIARGNRVPLSSSAFTDIDGDGRVDAVLWSRSIGSTPIREVYLHRGSGFTAAATSYFEFDTGDGSLLTSSEAEQLRFADITQENIPSGSALEARALEAADLIRLGDVTDDGLPDIVIPGGLCTAPSASECPGRPLGLAAYDWKPFPGNLPGFRGKFYIPAVVLPNLGNKPDLLTNVKATTGSITDVAYVNARTNADVVVSNFVPPGMQVVSSVSHKASVNAPRQYKHMRYEDFTRANATESLGFERVSVTIRDTVKEGSNEFDVVQRGIDAALPNLVVEFDVTPDDGYARRGLVVERTYTAAGLKTNQLTDRALTELAFGWKRIDELSTLTRHECVDSACTGTPKDVENLVVARASNGLPSVVVTASGTSQVESQTRYIDRVSDWQLGLPESEETWGAKYGLGGSQSYGLLAKMTASYDVNGRLSTKEYPDVVPATCAGLDRTKRTQVLSYTADGLPSSVLDGSLVIGTSYDSFGLSPRTTSVIFATFVDGKATGGNTKLEASQFVDVRTGAVWTKVDANGKKTSTTHDADGRPLRSHDALGRLVARRVYADQDQPSAYEERFQAATLTGQRTTTQYDGDGNALTVTNAELSGQLFNPIRVAQNVYDSAGHAMQSYLPRIASLGETTPPVSAPRVDRSFDGRGRIVSEKQPGPANRLTTWTYGVWTDASADARDVITTRQFDHNGQVISLIREAGGLVAETAYRRDGLGRLVNLVNPDKNMQEFEIDLGGRVQAYTLPHAKESPASGVFQQCFDNNGILRASVTATGSTITTDVDAVGRPVVRNLKTSSNAAEYTWTYDQGVGNAGRLAYQSTPVATTSATYDARGFPIKRSIKFNAAAAPGAPAEMLYTSSFGYFGELDSVTAKGDGVALGSIVMTRDLRGRPKAVKDAGTEIAANGIYDPQGRLTSVNLGVPTTPSTDRVTGTWSYDATTQDLMQIAYYNPARKLTRISFANHDALGVPLDEIRDGVVDAAGSGVDIRKTWAFDPLGRLSRQTILKNGNSIVDDKVHSWTPNGRLLDVTTSAGHVTRYAYADGRLPGAVTGVFTASDERRLGWDDDGAMTSDQGGQLTSSFDANGCLLKLLHDDGRKLEQICDASGNPVLRRSTDRKGETKTIIPTPTGELRVEDRTLSHRIPVNGTITMELDYKLTGGRLSTSTIVMGDGRGSVLATAPLLQTTSPSTTAAQEFDAWGKPISIASKVPRHGYVGFEADAAFGTYSFGRRVYDPTLRRWLSADPLLSANPEVDGQATQLDIWGYAGANPARFTDQQGTYLEAAFELASIGIGVASIQAWNSDTSTVDRVVDVVSLVYDVAALAVPALPGVAGAGVKAGREAAEVAVDAGTAIVKKYERDGARHVTVEIRGADGKSLGEFHQTGNTTTSIEPSSLGKSWKEATTTTVPIADPKAAAKFGETAGDQGKYNLGGNDCVSGACKIVNAGAPDTPVKPKELRQKLDMPKENKR